ncbi:energy transducer TonB [Fodinibius sp.]|uniref:energy transducer TonB n=1 Tax=Fodinibius sp. TaxID=1872440 RepID=UPI002ACE1EEC|nr:energy transducer TonB [Fodinibius sp.]MDZ7659533.1 energy transducer TonB [Fodinibius sp.]
MYNKSISLLVLLLAIGIWIGGCGSSYQIPRNNTVSVDSLETYSVAEVDSKPKPVGGYKYLLSKMEYPQGARDRGIKGKVIVNFLVTKDGNGIGHYIKYSPHPMLSKEALRLVKGTKFTPGKIDSQPVNTWLSLPFHFKMAKK